MATTTTWGTIFDRLVDNEIREFGILFTGTATSGGVLVTTTDPRLASGGDNQVTSRFEGRILWTAGGAKRSVLSIDTVEATGVTTITCAGPNFASTETDVAIYILAEDPDIILNLGNKALNELHFEAEVPLMHGPVDGDMQVSGVTNWTATNATRLKVTTADSVWSMAQSMTVTDSGSGNGYVESALYNVTAGKQITLHMIAKGGSGKLQVLDSSDNVLETISFDAEHWAYGRKTISPNVQQIKLRLVTVDASGVIIWQGAWFVRQGDLTFRLPSWTSNRAMIKNVSVAHFWESAEGDLYAGDSAYYRSLTQGAKRGGWTDIKRTADANVRLIRLTNNIADWPLFVLVDCPFSNPYGIAATFSSLASTTVCPEDLLLAKVKAEIGQRYPETWPEAATEGTADVLAQEVTVEQESYMPAEVSGFSRAFRSRR